MSAALLERPLRRAVRQCAGRRHGAGAGGETTLEQIISRAWEGLAVRASVACPLCGGAMAPLGTTPGGRCDCGSELT
ncbi:MAG: hypothetical protein ACR2HD_06880 [Solirubrobacteraceae bacterium]|nr:MAG: hypothetical protein DLM63_07720 [Solirubrobacterales bacterium]